MIDGPVNAGRLQHCIPGIDNRIKRRETVCNAGNLRPSPRNPWITGISLRVIRLERVASRSKAKKSDVERRRREGGGGGGGGGKKEGRKIPLTTWPPSSNGFWSRQSSRRGKTRAHGLWMSVSRVKRESVRLLDLGVCMRLHRTGARVAQRGIGAHVLGWTRRSQLTVTRGICLPSQAYQSNALRSPSTRGVPARYKARRERPPYGLHL